MDNKQMTETELIKEIIHIELERLISVIQDRYITNDVGITYFKEISESKEMSQLMMSLVKMAHVRKIGIRVRLEDFRADNPE